MVLKYEHPKCYSKVKINEILKNGDEEEISHMLLGITFNGDDLEYVFNIMKKFFRCENNNILSMIFLCLGHLARIHERLPEQEVLDLYKAYRNSEDLTMQGRMECFMDDVEVFIPEFFKKLENTK